MPDAGTPVILVPAYYPMRMRRLPAAVRAAVVEGHAMQLLEKCQGRLVRLPINEAAVVQDYMHAATQAGL